MSKAWTRTIPLRSKEFRRVKIIKEWTKHHPIMDNPMDGILTKEMEVFYLIEAEKIKKCIELPGRGVIVLKHVDGVTWFEAAASNLHGS